VITGRYIHIIRYVAVIQATAESISSQKSDLKLILLKNKPLKAQ